MSEKWTDATEVLIIEDERELADVFAAWLERSYAVRTAYTGEEALELVDSSIDIVLLDRRLPGISGTELLGKIREREIDCQVAMVSAVKPTAEMLKLDIDEYVRKPVSRGELDDLVAELERRHSLEVKLQTFLAELAKNCTLESERSADDIAYRFTPPTVDFPATVESGPFATESDPGDRGADGDRRRP